MAQAASFWTFARRAHDAGLRPGYYAVLQLIDDNLDITQTEISRASARDKSTLTSVLKALARLGLVVRRRGAEDKRIQHLRLTPLGRKKLASLRRCADAHNAKLDRIVGKPNKRALIGMLDKIIAEIDR